MLQIKGRLKEINRQQRHCLFTFTFQVSLISEGGLLERFIDIQQSIPNYQPQNNVRKTLPAMERLQGKCHQRLWKSA